MRPLSRGLSPSAAHAAELPPHQRKHRRAAQDVARLLDYDQGRWAPIEGALAQCTQCQVHRDRV